MKPQGETSERCLGFLYIFAYISTSSSAYFYWKNVLFFCSLDGFKPRGNFSCLNGNYSLHLKKTLYEETFSDMDEKPPNSVRRWRRWNDISQSELAEKVAVSRQTIANIEKGNYSPSVHLALEICHILGKSVEQIFGKEQETQ